MDKLGKIEYMVSSYLLTIGYLYYDSDKEGKSIYYSKEEEHYIVVDIDDKVIG